MQAEIAAEPPPPALRKIVDPLDRMAAAVLSYLNAATEPGIKRILLIDGPAVIGWRKWREIDDQYFGAGTHAVMGMVMEAALVCATAPDAKKAAREMTAAMRKLLEGIRRPS